MMGLEALMHRDRYAVSQGTRPLTTYLDAAAEAAGPSSQPFVLRFADSGPVTVSVRERPAERGARPRLLTIYLDPSTARVVDMVDFRSSFFGFLHRFHENLTIPEYSGRAIVGWVGVAMLIMSLTGLYLWWPRNSAWKSALRWRRGPGTASNLHHLLGLAISLPLALVSLTGIYLGFPQQGRAVLSSVAAMSPQARGGFAAPLMRARQQTIDQVADIARASVPDGRVAAIFLPAEATQAWRVQMRRGDEPVTVTIDDRSGGATVAPALPGDRIAAWIRGLHDGSRGGLVWQVAVFLCGIFPAIFVVTGLMIWLQRRSRRAAFKRMTADMPQLGAAE
jgi:uncharacterized iron-regulated membrane protein